MSDDNKLMAGLLIVFGAIAGLPILFFVTALTNGWVLVKLWAWFIVPVFNLPVLGLWQAIGVSFIVSHMTHQYVKDNSKFGETLAFAIANPIFALFFGWLIHLAGRP